MQAIIPVKGGAARLSVGVQPYHTRQALEMDNGHCGMELSGMEFSGKECRAM